MHQLYNLSAPKKPTNVSVNTDLLAKARALKINLSAALEEALLKRLKEEQRAQWLQENQEAIANYNDHVESNGVFSNGFRKF